jgi:hypothetical protein
VIISFFMATLVQYPAITLDSGHNTGVYYHQVAIKVSFRSAPTVEGARGASSNRAIGASVSGGNRMDHATMITTVAALLTAIAALLREIRGCRRGRWAQRRPAQITTKVERWE